MKTQFLEGRSLEQRREKGLRSALFTLGGPMEQFRTKKGSYLLENYML